MHPSSIRFLKLFSIFNRSVVEDQSRISDIFKDEGFRNKHSLAFEEASFTTESMLYFAAGDPGGAPEGDIDLQRSYG